MHAKAWLLQLDTSTNKIVHHWAIACKFPVHISSDKGKNVEDEKAPLEIVHTYFCGSMKIPSLDGNVYF